MQTGKVKFFNEAKGFGFVVSESGTEYFVHASGLKEKVKEGDTVTFDVEDGKKGPMAVNVSKS
ncbi:MAG: cold shock domain-containing protein [Sediminibacterium sp.]|jgi:CspA family cold shock protein